MDRDWERRLAERTMAVAVASGELVEVVDPVTGEMHYAPACRYDSVECLPELSSVEIVEVPTVTGGRHAAPKRPSRVRTGALATFVAGLIAVPALAVAAGAWQTTRLSSVYTDATPDDSDATSDATSDPQPMLSTAPVTEPAPAASEQIKRYEVKPVRRVAPKVAADEKFEPRQKRGGKHRKVKDSAPSPTPTPAFTTTVGETPSPAPSTKPSVGAQVDIEGLVTVDVDLFDLVR